MRHAKMRELALQRLGLPITLSEFIDTFDTPLQRQDASDLLSQLVEEGLVVSRMDRGITYFWRAE